MSTKNFPMTIRLLQQRMYGLAMDMTNGGRKYHPNAEYAERLLALVDRCDEFFEDSEFNEHKEYHMHINDIFESFKRDVLNVLKVPDFHLEYKVNPSATSVSIRWWWERLNVGTVSSYSLCLHPGESTDDFVNRIKGYLYDLKINISVLR